MVPEKPTRLNGSQPKRRLDLLEAVSVDPCSASAALRCRSQTKSWDLHLKAMRAKKSCLSLKCTKRKWMERSPYSSDYSGILTLPGESFGAFGDLVGKFSGGSECLQVVCVCVCAWWSWCISLLTKSFWLCTWLQRLYISCSKQCKEKCLQLIRPSIIGLAAGIQFNLKGLIFELANISDVKPSPRIGQGHFNQDAQIETESLLTPWGLAGMDNGRKGGDGFVEFWVSPCNDFYSAWQPSQNRSTIFPLCPSNDTFLGPGGLSH